VEPRGARSVLDQPNDFHRAARRLATRDARAQPGAAADGIGPGQKLAGKRLVDDRHPRRSRTIRVRERATAQDSHPHYLEVIGRDGIGKRTLGDTGRWHDPFNGNDVAPAAPAEQARHGCACRTDSGNPGRALDQAAIERTPFFDIERALPRGSRDVEEQHAFRVEADVDALELDQASREQSGSHEQDERHRNLRDDEHAAQTDAPGSLRGTTGRFQCRQGIDSPGPQRGGEPEHERGQDGDTQRECQHTHVRRRIDRQRQGTRRHRCQGRARPPGEQQSRNAAGRGEKQRLGERLPDDAHPSGTDGETHGRLAAPRFAASQHQVGDIRAGNDQNEANQPHQNHQRRRELAAQSR
jgi:hypothetical protein